MGHGNGGRLGATSARSNAAARPTLGRPLDDAGVAGEAAFLLGTRAQVGAGRAGQPRIDLVEAAARAHGGDRRRQLALRGRGVVHVVGGDALDADPVGDLDQRVVAGGVDRVAVVPELDEHAVAPERADQPLELATGGGGTVVEQAPPAPPPCGTR